ncbi:MAG: hypothetical protein EGQ63_04470, partial [Clostridiales bacterium]|nr:hypothetical protein [Clostridiales bacterium]
SLSSSDGNEVETRCLVPLVVQEAPETNEKLWKSLWSKMLLVPYDNTMWLRYEAVPLRAGRKSYDLTVLFQEDTREGLLIGAIDFDEPFTKLFNQGMICGRDRETGAATKMSKSLGNIVSPDDMVRDYGCDALRMYELFIGPPELDSIWDDRGIDGVYRFLTRFYTMVTKNIENPGKETPELIKIRHKMVYDITTRLESFSLNTVVSGFMEYNNKLVDLTKKGGVDTETLKTVVRLIAPFAPHMGEELWQQLGGTDTVFASGWPTYEEDALKDNEVTIPVQINGKTKGTIDIAVDDAKDAVIAKGKEAIADKLAGLNVIKEIYIPGKIVNIVAK